MDLVDSASEVADIFTAEALAKCVGRSGAETHPDFDGATCVECTEDIPPGRLVLGRVRCVRCQSRIERKAKWA